MPTEHTFCRICESLCGLEVDVEDGRVLAIRPDPEHVATDGFACVKGLKQHHLTESPDRLLQPQKRVGDTWQEISWEQALAEIGEKVAALRRARGPDSIGMYVGTAAGFSILHPIFAQGFMEGIGSRSMYASATQDCANKFAVSRQIYGFPFTLPFPDLLRTECLIIVGANPAVSKWSFLQVPNPAAHLRAIEQRGGTVFVVDPRRTETARLAGEHVFIEPDTDVFFYLSFLHELLATEGAVDEERVARSCTGMEEIRALARGWTPERTAPVTGIDAATLRRMVATYVEADGAALYCSTGVNMGSHGSQAFWLQEVINAVSGNLDRAGGTLVGEGIFDFARFGKRTGTLMKSGRSRVGDLPTVNDARPGGVLADEILTPGEGQVRAMFITGGNPLLTMANSGRMREAFEDLELLVCLDIVRNETASLAHYVLPCTSALERPDLPFVFPLWLGMQVRPYLQATGAVVPPRGAMRDEPSIYHDLCKAAGVGLFGSRIATAALDGLRWLWGRLHPEHAQRLPLEWLLGGMLRITGNGGFGRLLAERHGRRGTPNEGGRLLGKGLITEDGKVHLAPGELVASLERVRERFEVEQDRAQAVRDPHHFRLITKRHIKTHNSWTHNHATFTGQRRQTNHLHMHPDDAAGIGLVDGLPVDVCSATAAVRLPLKLNADLRPGTVALPHGWGHQHATGLSHASATQGVNVNLLAADGPGALEPVSGMAHLTGIPVEVRAAAGPRDPKSWSGISPSEPSPAPSPTPR